MRCESGEYRPAYAGRVQYLMRVAFITVLFTLAAVLRFSASAQSPTTASAKISAAGVWQPPRNIFTKVSKFCQTGAGPESFSVCYMNQLAAQGEPPEAVKFTRWLFDHFDQNVGIMTAFKSYAPVDAAQVMIPLRANDNYALLLINGDPSIIDVDDLQKLDREAMEADPLFQSIKQKYPQTDLWPGDRSGSDPWPRVQPLAGGGKQFVVTFPLINGCHAWHGLPLRLYAQLTILSRRRQRELALRRTSPANAHGISVARS